MKNSRKHSGAFTLVEMLVVVTLIAIVATIAIVLLGGARKDAAEMVNLSNIKHLTSLLGAHEAVYDGCLPNKVDSLLDADKLSNASYVEISPATQFQAAIEVVDDPGTVIYCGLDRDMDGYTENPTGSSLGILPDAWRGSFASLTVSKLTTNDVAQLNKIGIFEVNDLLTETGELFNGYESYSSRVLQAGDPVVVVDPQKGRNGTLAYKTLGFHEISNSEEYERTPESRYTDLTESARGKAMAAKRYLVFGIGPNSTLVGNSKIGVTDAPKSKILAKGYYSHYFMIVKVGNPPVDVSTVLAGVMDPQGNVAPTSESWATRTGN